MGIYLNSEIDVDDSKDAILKAINATQISREIARNEPPQGMAILARYWNGGFNALGLLYSPEEREYVTNLRDGRLIEFYHAPKEALKGYLPESIFTRYCKEPAECPNTD